MEKETRNEVRPHFSPDERNPDVRRKKKGRGTFFIRTLTYKNSKVELK